jgi:hypothetical protein
MFVMIQLSLVMEFDTKGLRFETGSSTVFFFGCRLFPLALIKIKLCKDEGCHDLSLFGARLKLWFPLLAVYHHRHCPLSMVGPATSVCSTVTWMCRGKEGSVDHNSCHIKILTTVS